MRWASSFPNCDVVSGIQLSAVELTRFAKSARYANLDALADGTAHCEPLVEWQEIAKELSDKLPTEVKAYTVAEGSRLTSFFEGHAVVLAHDLANKPLSVSSMISQEVLMKTVSPYVILNLVALIVPVTTLVSRLALEAKRIVSAEGSSRMTIPHMDEFYDFLSYDEEYVLSRTTWS